MVHPLLDEVRAGAQGKFMAFASNQVVKRGAVQFNYMLQIHNRPQAALCSRVDGSVQIRKMALEQLSGYSNGDCGIGCA
jgi:hypothetical protein